MKFTKRSVITTVLAVTVVAAIAVGSSIAYFTSSDDVTNTFTMGDIEINLTEDEWNDETDGKNMLPGDTLYKNPVVTAIEGDSYMRIKVELIDSESGEVITDAARAAKILGTLYYSPDEYGAAGNCEQGSSYSVEALTELGFVPGVNTTDFELDSTKSTQGIKYYNYIGGDGIFSQAPAPAEEACLFTHVIIPTDWTRSDMELLGTYNIRITAQAIQSMGFDTAALAYAELPD